MAYPTFIAWPSRLPDGRGEYAAYVNAVRQQIQAMPDYLLRLANIFKASVQVAHTRHELPPDNRSDIGDRVIRHGKTSHPDEASFDPETNKITLAARLYNINNGQSSLGEIQDPTIFNHETTHLLVNAFNDILRRSGQSDKSLMDLKWFQGPLRADHIKNGDPLTNKAFEETLADAGQAVADYTNGRNTKHLQEYARDYSNTFRALYKFHTDMSAISQRYPDDRQFLGVTALYARHLDGKDTGPNQRQEQPAMSA